MRLLILILSVLLLLGCVSTPKPINEYQCFAMVGGGFFVPVCIKNNDSNLEVDERGYMLFDTFEEMQRYFYRKANERFSGESL